MTNDVNFDALTQRTIKSNGAMEDLNDLYGAVFALPQWHFIARGEIPNVNPYIAANAQYADGQQMVRAFTDTDRLLRFAKENNLTNPDGGASILSVPTDNIVEYLEQFTEYGVHGVWFNSDTQSDGFFMPLKQLRPIKAHLEKLSLTSRAAPKNTVETLIVVVKDGLMLPSGFIAPSSYTCNLFCRVPTDWTEAENIKPDYLEKIYEKVYGPAWRSGNSDGSRYVVQDSYSKVFTPEVAKTTVWKGTVNDDVNHFWFYIASEGGDVKNVTDEEFQADIDAYFKDSAREAAPLPRNAAEDFGLTKTPDGEIDQMLSINQRGAVNYDASIMPFYHAIMPLLEDYKGAGEYNALLAFDPNSMTELVENIFDNAHGAILRVRSFLYHNPKNNVNIGVTNIHSSDLRHIKTNSSLNVSFELCRNLDNQTAAFYFALTGAGSEVRNIIATIQPLLDDCGFEAAA